MSRTRLYCPSQLVTGREMALDENDFWRLIKVKRHRVGDKLTVFNGNDGEFAATFRVLGRSSGVIGIEQHIAAPPQRRQPAIDLRMAPIRPHLLRATVQSATEMGMASFGTVCSQYSRREREQTDKWQQIMIAATEQSGGFEPPKLVDQQSLATVLAEPTCLVAAEFVDTRLVPTAITNQPRLTLLVGPEGGFSPDEQDLIRQSAALCVSLGDRLLRAETAAIALLSVVRFVTDSTLA